MLSKNTVVDLFVLAFACFSLSTNWTPIAGAEVNETPEPIQHGQSADEYCRQICLRCYLVPDDYLGVEFIYQDKDIVHASRKSTYFYNDRKIDVGPGNTCVFNGTTNVFVLKNSDSTNRPDSYRVIYSGSEENKPNKCIFFGNITINICPREADATNYKDMDDVDHEIQPRCTKLGTVNKRCVPVDKS